MILYRIKQSYYSASSLVWTRIGTLTLDQAIEDLGERGRLEFLINGTIYTKSTKEFSDAFTKERFWEKLCD